jgi:hypothetical protein
MKKTIVSLFLLLQLSAQANAGFPVTNPMNKLIMTLLLTVPLLGFAANDSE